MWFFDHVSENDIFLREYYLSIGLDEILSEFVPVVYPIVKLVYKVFLDHSLSPDAGICPSLVLCVYYYAAGDDSN